MAQSDNRTQRNQPTEHSATRQQNTAHPDNRILSDNSLLRQSVTRAEHVNEVWT